MSESIEGRSPVVPPPPDARPNAQQLPPPDAATWATPTVPDDERPIDRWSADTIRSRLEWWYRPLIEARTWTTLGSLFVGALWGPLVAVALITVFSVTFALLAVGIGLLLVVPTFALLNAFATTERARAQWVGKRIDAPKLLQSAPGAWSRLTTPLRDGARWKQLLFFALFLVGGPVLFALGLLPWAFLLRLVFGEDFEPDTFSVEGFILAAVIAGAAPRATIGVAWVGRAFTESLLGPSETDELQERVSELSGQREQILDAVAVERRRIERNLHDGVQQQLVALGIDIGRAKARLTSDPDGAAELLDDARDKVRGSIGELRLIGRGLHPAVLEDRGLDAALSSVVASAPIPVSVQITATHELSDDIASTAYYVATEAVANVLKHSGARVASIRMDDHPRIDDAVRLIVHDDGRGGADGRRGTGLAGMRARVEAVDGILDVDSPIGGPTRIVAVLPTEGGVADGR